MKSNAARVHLTPPFENRERWAIRPATHQLGRIRRPLPGAMWMLFAYANTTLSAPACDCRRMPASGCRSGCHRECESGSALQIPVRMKSFVDHQTVAGVVTLIARDNDVLESDAYGMADIEAGHPKVCPSMEYRAGLPAFFTAIARYRSSLRS
ncbi:MAG: hypothetical protein DMG76_25505 [Acidobacteria bacterium]|nr:MAG: hypothetical protein DMG76_25505 [Acidobacteriota bacterium]